MLKYDAINDTYRATYLSDLLNTDLTTGSVFHLHVQPMFMPGGRCLTMRVALVANEGRGKRYEFLLANNQIENLPTQVELALMDIDCVPTWSWDHSFTGKAYICEFARSKTHKAVSDSGAYRFEKIL